MGQKKTGKKTSPKKYIKKGKKELNKLLGKGGSGSKRKKSAIWYLKEVARLKAKAKYQKQKMRVL